MRALLVVGLLAVLSADHSAARSRSIHAPDVRRQDDVLLSRHPRSRSAHAPDALQDDFLLRDRRSVIASRVVDSRGNVVRLRPANNIITRRIVHAGRPVEERRIVAPAGSVGRSGSVSGSVRGSVGRSAGSVGRSAGSVRGGGVRSAGSVGRSGSVSGSVGRSAGSVGGRRWPLSQPRAVNTRRLLPSLPLGTTPPRQASMYAGGMMSPNPDRMLQLPNSSPTEPTKQQHPAAGPSRSIYGHNKHFDMGYHLTEGMNAANMTLFLFRNSGRRQSYLDRTHLLATVYSDRAGECPLLSTTNCPPLSTGVSLKSCSNDFHCRGGQRCCYHPCLTVNKCVDAVHQ